MRTVVMILAALSLSGPAAPARAADAPPAFRTGTQLAGAGIGTSRFGRGTYRPGYRTYRRPTYRTYRRPGYGRGFFHGLFTGWFFSHFFGYGFGFGFPLWPFFLLLLFVWMSSRSRRRRW